MPDVVVVGGSTAGSTVMRELRRRGHDGTITLLDPDDGTNRPPLSKTVLADRDGGGDSTVLIDHTPLDLRRVREAAIRLDPEDRVVHAADGTRHRYDALVVATGSRARSIASAGQRGEVVLRTVADAARLRDRIASSSTAIVVGAGFLGLEVATAMASAGVDVTVVDPDPPLQRLLGPHLSGALVERAQAVGISFVRAAVALSGDPVDGVRLDDGTPLTADLVVSCIGDEPNVDWLEGSGLATPHGVLIDRHARTEVPGVWAVGDVAAVRDGGVARRAPFWANAVTQGRVAAASILGQPVDDPIHDAYFWTAVAGITLKAVGPLPVDGVPRVVEDAGDGTGVFAWPGPTVVALGVRAPVPRLRRLARELAELG